MGKIIKLPARLQAIAGCIETGAKVADIGTDHGMLPAYLAQNNLASSIIASDKSAESLKSALRTAAKYDVTDMIKFVTADGLAGISETEADAIVTAGVGGETIIKILEDAPWTKKAGIRLILQPQTKIDELRRWLCENGYAIADTVPVSDKGRVYTILIAGGS